MDYEEMLAQVKDRPEEADFLALRRSYAQSDQYQPYFGKEEWRREFSQAAENESWDIALEAVEKRLEECYVDIEAHMLADYLWEQKGGGDRGAYHRFFARGLIGSILNEGGGQTVDKPLEVIQVAEEYIILQVLGLEMVRQALVEHEGRRMDVIYAVDKGSGKEVELYFDLEMPLNWLDRQYETEKG